MNASNIAAAQRRPEAPDRIRAIGISPAARRLERILSNRSAELKTSRQIGRRELPKINAVPAPSTPPLKAVPYILPPVARNAVVVPAASVLRDYPVTRSAAAFDDPAQVSRYTEPCVTDCTA